VLARTSRGAAWLWLLAALLAAGWPAPVPGSAGLGGRDAAAGLDPRGWTVWADVSGELAALAFDGDPWTEWTAGGAGRAELRLDLGKPETINRVYWQAGGAGPPERFEIAGSSDGETWFPISDSETGLYVVDESGLQVLFAPATVQHVRLRVEAGPAGELSLSELEVYGPGQPVRVRIYNFKYLPETVLVAKGTTVVWVNEDGPPHTVTGGLPADPPQSRLFDSAGQAEGRYDLMMQGDRWSFTFHHEGVYDYFCLPHTFMVARVKVVDP